MPNPKPKPRNSASNKSSGGNNSLAGALVLGALIVLAALIASPSSGPRQFGQPALGTPGGGYVAGAPRSPAECIARGGINTGRGCAGYR